MSWSWTRNQERAIDWRPTIAVYTDSSTIPAWEIHSRRYSSQFDSPLLKLPSIRSTPHARADSRPFVCGRMRNDDEFPLHPFVAHGPPVDPPRRSVRTGRWACSRVAHCDARGCQTRMIVAQQMTNDRRIHGHFISRMTCGAGFRLEKNGCSSRPAEMGHMVGSRGR